MHQGKPVKKCALVESTRNIKHGMDLATQIFDCMIALAKVSVMNNLLYVNICLDVLLWMNIEVLCHVLHILPSFCRISLEISLVTSGNLFFCS